MATIIRQLARKTGVFRTASVRCMSSSSDRLLLTMDDKTGEILL